MKLNKTILRYSFFVIINVGDMMKKKLLLILGIILIFCAPFIASFFAYNIIEQNCHTLFYDRFLIRKIILIFLLVIGVVLIIISKPKLKLLIPIIILIILFVIFFVLPFLKRGIGLTHPCSVAENCKCNENNCDCIINIDDNTTCNIKCPTRN